MLESNQKNENETTLSIDFPNWKPFSQEKITNQLPPEIKYIAPHSREDLRQKIIENKANLKEDDIKLLTIILKFLEQGLMIDSFQSDEDKRHKFLLENNITIENNGEKQQITLYQLSKNVSKLSGNAISRIILVGQIIISDNRLDEKNRNQLNEEVEKLKNKVEDKKKRVGYFLQEDLEEVDNFALKLFNLIINRLINS